VNYSTGNYGALDMVEALKWVKDNIAVFGAPTDKVTIFGESAGAASVAVLQAMPDAITTYKGEKLFHSAIMQSGGFS